LIALIIKIIKKYKYLRLFFKLINRMIVGIFGFSLFDIWGVDLFHGWFAWIRQTPIYLWFATLIATKGYSRQTENRSGWEVKTPDWETEKTKGSYKNGNWEARQFDWNTPETTEIANNSDNTYLYLALFLIFCGFAYYYREDLYKLGNLFRKPDNPPSDDLSSPLEYVEEPVNRNIFDRIKAVFWPNNEQAKLKQIVKDRFNGSDLESIKLNNVSQETIKPEYTSKMEPVATTSKVTLDQPDTVFKPANIEGFTDRMIEAQFTGENYLNFRDKSKTLMAQINSFLTYHKIDSFPSIVAQQALYHSLRTRLLQLSLNERWYNMWLNESNVEARIDEFIRVEDEVYNYPTIEDVDSGSDGSSKTWSDVSEKQSTPQQEAHPLETVENEEVAIEKPKAKVDSLFDRIKARREAISPSSELLESENVIKQEPNIKPKPKFNSWLDEIRSRRNDDHVVGSPIRETDEIETIQPSVDANSTPSTSGINQLLDQIRGRRNDVDVVGSPIRETEAEIIQDDENNFLATQATNVVDGVNQSLETTQAPIETEQPLAQLAAVNNQFDDTALLFEDDDTLIQDDNHPAPNNSPDLDLINSWDKVKTTVDGPIVNLEFGQMWKHCKEVNITTSDNKMAVCTFRTPTDTLGSSSMPDPIQTVNLRDFISWNSGAKVRGVSVVDENNFLLVLYSDNT